MKKFKNLLLFIVLAVIFSNSNVLKAQENGIILPPDLVTIETDIGITNSYLSATKLSSNRNQGTGKYCMYLINSLKHSKVVLQIKINCNKFNSIVSWCKQRKNQIVPPLNLTWLIKNNG